ncbi:MAG: hypothetical protein ACK5KR_00120 [Breznakia sp.]
MKKIMNVCLVFGLILTSLLHLTALLAKEKPTEMSADYLGISTIDVEGRATDAQLLIETEKNENELVQKVARKTRTGLWYDVKIKVIKTQYKWTGFKVVAGQPSGGVNFGKHGGEFGYMDGNSYNSTTLLFGVSAFGVGVSIGVGHRVSSGSAGYNITAPKTSLYDCVLIKESRLLSTSDIKYIVIMDV